MKNKKIFIILGLTLLLIIAGMVFTVRNYQLHSLAKKRLQVFQSLPIIGMDSSYFDFSKLKFNNLVLVYFDSDCEQCVVQANELNKNEPEFVNTNILFVSSEPILKIKRFSFGFKRTQSIFFAKINYDDVYAVFGSYVTPQIFIYNKHGRLSKILKGAVTANVIKNYLM